MRWKASAFPLLLALLCWGAPAWTAEKVPVEKKHEPFQYDPAGHRDPFVPLIQNGKVVTGFGASDHGSGARPVLHGILWDPGGQSLALINDGEAKVGDLVGDYRIEHIRKDAVVLNNGTETITLQILFDIAPKTPPKKNAKGGEGP